MILAQAGKRNWGIGSLLAGQNQLWSYDYFSGLMVHLMTCLKPDVIPKGMRHPA
jgi:hypothetical protein